MTSNQAAYSLAIGNGGEVAVGPGAILSTTSNFSLDGDTLSVDPNGAFFTGGTVTIDADASLRGGPISAGGYQLDDGAVARSLPARAA